MECYFFNQVCNVIEFIFRNILQDFWVKHINTSIYKEFLSGFLGLMFRSGVSGVVSVNVSFASEAGGAAPRWLSNLGE